MSNTKINCILNMKDGLLLSCRKIIKMIPPILMLLSNRKMLPLKWRKFIKVLYIILVSASSITCRFFLGMIMETSSRKGCRVSSHGLNFFAHVFLSFINVLFQLFCNSFHQLSKVFSSIIEATC